VLLAEPEVVEPLPPRPEEFPVEVLPLETLPLEIELGLVSGELRIPPEEREALSGATLDGPFRSEPLALKLLGTGLDRRAALAPRRRGAELASCDQRCQPAGPPHPNPRRAASPHRYQPAPFHPVSYQQ